MEPYLTSWLTASLRPRVIVLGNEKGGSGKSTVAIHLAMGLAAAGLRVGTIDLDGRQGTLSHFMENRKISNQTAGKNAQLACPEHRQISLSRNAREDDNADEKLAQLVTALESLNDRNVIVVDTPGSDSVLARAAHICADMLITPLNSSFLDLDALVKVDETASRITGPSVYSEMILYMSEKRADLKVAPIDWLVITNRLPNVATRVHRSVMDILKQLSARLGFRILPPFHERVIFRGLFLEGRTVLDITNPDANAPPLQNVASAQGEIEALVDEILVRGPWKDVAARRARAAGRANPADGDWRTDSLNL
jgi:chromosome partitioning protein